MLCFSRQKRRRAGLKCLLLVICYHVEYCGVHPDPYHANMAEGGSDRSVTNNLLEKRYTLPIKCLEIEIIL
jgi:hypothetical protein